jgi:micrococcal nuclease
MKAKTLAIALIATLSLSSFGSVICTSTNAVSIEIYAFDQNPAGYDSGNEWVTLYNPTTNAIDIGDWTLETTHGKTVTATIPQNTIIDANDFWTYTHPTGWLDNEGESIVLKDATGEEVDRTSIFSDPYNDNRYWRKENSTWIFGVEELDRGIIREGMVSYVVDGDTIDISPVGIAGIQRIRLVCIDTPEKGEEGYEEAKNFVNEMCLGKDVEFDVDDVTQYDPYNRILAVVYINGTNLNAELLNKGYAEIWEGYNSSKSEFNPHDWIATSENDDGIPGFELLFFVVAIAIVLLWKRKRY